MDIFFTELEEKTESRKQNIHMAHDMIMSYVNDDARASDRQFTTIPRVRALFFVGSLTQLAVSEKPSYTKDDHEAGTNKLTNEMDERNQLDA